MNKPRMEIRSVQSGSWSLSGYEIATTGSPRDWLFADKELYSELYLNKKPLLHISARVVEID